MRIDRVDVDANAMGRGLIVITLSRRNLRTLLAQLDGFPAFSAATIVFPAGHSRPGLVVHAEEDDKHYGRRGYGPGLMHPETEARLEGNLRIGAPGRARDDN